MMVSKIQKTGTCKGPRLAEEMIAGSVFVSTSVEKEDDEVDAAETNIESNSK